MTNILREPLGNDQRTLLRTIWEPFALSGEWPIWQFVDLTLDRMSGLDAAAVLSSLPRVRHPDPAMWSSSYALVWYMNISSFSQPSPEQEIGLTIAGLQHLPEGADLLGAFLVTLTTLAEAQLRLVPSPTSIVEATVTGSAIAEQILNASISGSSAPPVDMTIRKLRRLLEHEPVLWAGVQPPSGAADWTIRVPAALRAFRDVSSIDNYLDRAVEWVAPAQTPLVAFSFGALDLPYCIGYLDAVWRARTRSHLFVNLDPASVGRLTQQCANEEEFNSLMSALADVLGQVVVPGKSSPPKGGALEAVQEHLGQLLEANALARVNRAIDTLVSLRHIRVGSQHADARHKAVAAFESLGMPFPPPSWDHAWIRVAVLAKGALDALREEVQTGLS